MIASGKVALFGGRAFFPRSPGLRVAALAVIVLFATPPLAVLFGAFGSATTNALSASALADYVGQTAIYAGATLLLAMLFALPAAWLTIMRRFPGDGLVSWALFLPLGLPPYISGYGWSHFLQETFAVQAHGVWLAAAVTALSVYPYIYLFARIALRQQSCHIQSAARLMGYSPLAAIGKISWPLARPAVAVGAVLALMETLNDIALAEHYGVRTLGLGVYDLWLNRGDIHSACRLSVLLMLLIVGLLLAEERGRQRQKHYASQCDRCFACDRAAPFAGWQKYACAPVLLLPAVGGFFLPVAWFGYLAARTDPDLWRAPFLEGLGGTLGLSASLVLVLFLFAMVFASDKRANGRGAWMRPAAKFAGAGYALPGAVLAQGFFLIASVVGGGFIAAGGVLILLLACSARFFIVAANATENGMEQISPQLDSAAKLAGKSALQIVFQVHLPLMRPALAAGALLVFLEGVKELPMTLILRPFNFNTLATMIYQYASDESPELAAPAVLATAVAGVVAITALFWMEGRNWRRG